MLKNKYYVCTKCKKEYENILPVKCECGNTEFVYRESIINK